MGGENTMPASGAEAAAATNELLAGRGEEVQPDLVESPVNATEDASQDSGLQGADFSNDDTDVVIGRDDAEQESLDDEETAEPETTVTDDEQKPAWDKDKQALQQELANLKKQVASLQSEQSTDTGDTGDVKRPKVKGVDNTLAELVTVPDIDPDTADFDDIAAAIKAGKTNEQILLARLDAIENRNSVRTAEEQLQAYYSTHAATIADARTDEAAKATAQNELVSKVEALWVERGYHDSGEYPDAELTDALIANAAKEIAIADLKTANASKPKSKATGAPSDPGRGGQRAETPAQNDDNTFAGTTLRGRSIEEIDADLLKRGAYARKK